MAVCGFVFCMHKIAIAAVAESWEDVFDKNVVYTYTPEIIQSSFVIDFQ